MEQQLGHHGERPSYRMRPLSGIHNAVELAVGRTLSCAAGEAGGLWCWGSGLSVTPVKEAHTARGLTIRGGASVCARSEAGELRCFTLSSERGSDRLKVSTEVVSDAVALVARRSAVRDPALCVSDASGTIRCHDNRYFDVEGKLPGAVQIAANQRALCGIDAAGALACFKSHGGRHDMPALPALKQIALGDEHFCALSREGKVLCWGHDEHGQLGRGIVFYGSKPRLVGRGVTDMAAGRLRSCVLRADGVHCTHHGDWPERCEEARFDPRDSSADVVALVQGGLEHAIFRGGVLKKWDQVKWRDVPTSTPGGAEIVSAVGSYAPTTLASDGSVATWDSSTRKMTPLDVDGVIALSPISVGSNFCVLTRSGVVSCSEYGKLRPTKDLSGVSTLAIGGHMLCGVRAGDVRCSSAVPRFEEAVEVAVGEGHVCVRSRAGEVRCAGANDRGQTGAPLADITSKQAHRVTLPGRAARVFAAYRRSCALLDNGDLYCWGDNEYGQLGAGPTACEPKPVDITDAILEATP